MFAGRFSSEEIRFFFNALSAGSRLPVIATNRPLREMGVFSGPEDLRLNMLEEAAKSGAEWIDLEHDADVGSIGVFRRAGAKVLLSWHDPAGTPDGKILRAKLESMSKMGADALKIATMARSDEDNLRVLELIPLAGRQFGIDLVAFCMGPAGRWSRVVSIFLGSPWTYAQFAGRPTAPGQLTVQEMRELIRRINAN
jgi:3-dehydroquinate dehydratase type I